MVSPRPLWFIQKWMVREGKAKEHEELQQRWGSYVSSQNKQHWYLHEPLGPAGTRIFIIRFDNFSDFENFFATMDKDEENVEFVGKWHSCIEPGSYNGFFWREREIE